MTNTRKTKAEMLQELESLKGLLLEEEDIPILQPEDYEIVQQTNLHTSSVHSSVLPGQGSLFDETPAARSTSSSAKSIPPINVPPTRAATGMNISRATAKPNGENPFLPQHIRERLHGNNPPPLFEYETIKKITSATKQLQAKNGSPRQQLIEDVIMGMMPQIETELRHRLFAMSTEELEQLLLSGED